MCLDIHVHVQTHGICIRNIKSFYIICNLCCSYNLADSAGDRFKIDEKTGLVSTAAILDREEQDKYQLVVVATDNGMVPKSSTVNLHISVDDTNDNKPQFDKRAYTVFIRDPTNAGKIG